MSDAAYVIVGRIRKAHGIRGELVVEPITDVPDAIFASGRRVLAGDTEGDPVGDAAPLEVTGVRPFKGGLLVSFAGIRDRTEAERWRDRYLLVPGESLPPLDADHIYVHDLVGMSVRGRGGDVIGAVVNVYELPQGLMLEVGRPGFEPVLVPFHESMVDTVDVESKEIVVDPPPGLLDE
ncbi:MAG TPA: ribosome maturation factor RimM [Gemmatimonadaceae bacterium]|nr:ribosome maturation factor RimM [Gemmatimonadaceae bacterium]